MQSTRQQCSNYRVDLLLFRSPLDLGENKLQPMKAMAVKHVLRASLLVVFTVISTGCSDRLRTYPVQGKVQFKTGGAVHVGTIELKSLEHAIQARGEINKGGDFTLTTYEEGDGAVAGTHKCVIVQFVMTEDVTSHRPSTIGVIDRKYAQYSTSDLQVTIDPDAETNQILLEVDGYRKTQPENHKH